MKKFLVLVLVGLLVFAHIWNSYAEEASVCLNCGTIATGRYCSACGYSIGESKPVIGENETFLSMKFDYENNIIFAKCDVDIQVDGSYIGTIKQKETLEKIIVVERGVHEITLHTGDEVRASVMVDAQKNALLSCTLKAHMNSLELKDVVNNSPASEEAAQAYHISKDYGWCKSVDYERLCRYPEEYEDMPVHLRGVVEATAENIFGTMNIIFKDQEGNPWYVRYNRCDNQPRLLVNDSVEIYGPCKGIPASIITLNIAPGLPVVEVEYLVLH